MGPIKFVFGPRRPKGYQPEVPGDVVPRTDEEIITPPKKEMTRTWVAYRDRNGTPCWLNKVTNQWTYEAPDPREVVEPQQQMFQVVQNPAAMPPPIMAHGPPWAMNQPRFNNPGGGIFPVSPVPVIMGVPPSEAKIPGQEHEETKQPVFVPSPVPGFQVGGWGPGVMPVSPVPVTWAMPPQPQYQGGGKKKSDKKVDHGKGKEGIWERKYTPDGGKYWKHSGTGECRSEDPFF